MKRSATLLIISLILISGCLTGLQNNFSKIDLQQYRDAIVEYNDTVKMNYILSTADEQVLDTSIEEVALNWGLNLSHPLEPKTVTVGDGRLVPGLEEILIGMKVGEQKESLIPPEKGYGERNESLIKTLPRYLEFPRIDALSIQEFESIFQRQPLIGSNYSLSYWNATVIKISNGTVTLLNDARNGSQPTSGGRVTLSVNATTISMIYNPRIGSPIMTVEGEGRVISIGPENYTVDLNHPLAGEGILVFVRVEEIIKPHSTEEGEITLAELRFLTSLEEGKRLAKESAKPIFLYVHAAWCSWCRKFEEDVLTDTEVLETLRRDFINVAVDVDRQARVTTEFKVVGTPTMIFLDDSGLEVSRIRGYRTAKDFKEILSSVFS